MAKEILVKTNNPKALDELLQHNFSSALVAEEAFGSVGVYHREGDCYVARCFAGADFVAFALEAQGYAEVISIRGIQS